MQEARAKWEVLQDRGVRWHLIGPLQKNKAGVAAEVFSSVHTIARVPTAVALGRRRGESENPVEILVQVNMDADPAKAGVAPQDAGPLLDELSGIEGIRARGLMMIGRQATDAAVTRSSFAQLRALRDELRGRGHEALTELSMGMSEDYGSAIEEGATMVRVGTAIVGQRVSRQEARST